MNMKLVQNTGPFFVTEKVYNGLCQFVYSDTKERIKIGDQAAWVEKTLDVPLKLSNGGICKEQLMLVNWDKIKKFVSN